MKQLGVKEKLITYMQFTVLNFNLKRTCESILVDVRNGWRSDWLESEVDELMNQLEDNYHPVWVITQTDFDSNQQNS